MNEVDRNMLHIFALDPRATLQYSTFTRQWYVSAKIEVKEGNILTGGSEHHDTPDGAVRLLLFKLQAVADPLVIVAAPTGEIRYYRWNGACFAETLFRWEDES